MTLIVCLPRCKSELDKSVDLSLCSLAPAQSQMDLFSDALCPRNKQRAANFNQSEEVMARVTASAMFSSEIWAPNANS